MNTLTKENFWNELMEKYPSAMKQFCTWIDEYKKRVNWDRTFKTVAWSLKHNRPANDEDWGTHERGEIVPYQYKYYDIPYAMQFGIFLQFIAEAYPNEADNMEKWQAGPENIKQMIKEIDATL